MEDVFLKNIKTVYTQHEYCWTANSSNTNILFFFLLLSSENVVICKHSPSVWLVIKN